ncbi:hypothetical protein BDQ12DRAFT_474872 [Crucibulum laeve]|uniref:Rho-GAP domain-containing protein n=1 Tax=Crucibulum laeve TaxID=68775 RepID=A0A5C3LI60_9AGAR|nr:hypothetical protein BDQ12DRAFT_474872 [Crucibulum laeve]
MAVLSLPLSFTNSFWTQDYRRGLEVLFEKLDQGVAENDEIVAFIRARANAEAQLASSLTNPGPTGRAGTGFSADDGASLLMAFRGLQAESAAQGQAHKAIAKELDTLVADPFADWAQGYRERIKQNKTTVIDNWLRSYEQAQGEVAKLKHQYLTKTRRADEAADDAKFAPNSDGSSDKFTSSPRMRPVDGRTPPQRTASVSERIALRLKEIQKKSVDVLAAATSTEDPNASPESVEEKPLPKVDKGKGKASEEQPIPEIASPPPMSPLPNRIELSASPVPPLAPEPMLLAGLSLPPVAISQLLTRAAAELPLRPVRFPLLGEYQDAFTGEEFVAWLNANVAGLGGSLDRAEDAARDLTEREGLLRRLGELGNQFEHSDDAFYQFRPKAFDLEGKNTEQKTGKTLQPDNLIKRTGTFVNLVSKALNTNAHGEPAYLRARHDAEEADRNYRISVRKLDRQRLGLEERIEETLKTLQRWEIERLRAVKTVLLQYQGTLANLPKSLEPSMERSSTVIAAYQPESDLIALIERYRTGPFRPSPQLYESVAHDESDVVFGIDLRKWAEGGWYALTSGEEKKELVPPVFTALLNGLTDAYNRLPNDAEKRKSWIYEVPLPAVHHLRESLNALPPDQPIPADLLARYDAPVIASAIKLWALELDPPLALYEGWEEFRKLYPAVGATTVKGEGEGENSEEQRLQNLSAALQRLPRVHLYVLDVLVKHIKGLIETTKVEEADEVYITKLALSVGRSIIRPKFESELSIQDRHPTLLFIDLVKNYDVLLPPTIARKKRESERKIPIRKRTAPVDMRLSRSRISVGADAQQLFAAQQVAQNPSLVKSMKSPELPQLPLPPVLSPSTQKQTLTTPPPPPALEKSATPPPPASVVPIVPPPPPPVIATPPPPPPPITNRNDNLPPRPSFKEPPPEDDDLPPRPSFKEPPPESDDEPSPPPMPRFASPPPEESDIPSPQPDAAPSPPTTAVIPPTPQKRYSVSSVKSRNTPSPSKLASRSPSPPADNGDVVLGSGRTSISRSGSAQSQAGVVGRGPRIARGPRAPGGGGGSVQSLVQNLNRQSVSGSPPPTPGSPGGNRINRLSGSPVRRPSSVLGRSSAFSRRTMASDAEDDVVERK